MAEPTFTLARTFNAPLARVWHAWTDEAQLERWWGPKGCTLLTCDNDPQPGSTFTYGMTTADGNAVWGKWVYREVVPMQTLVFIASFTDENWNPVRHPLAPTWPLTLLSTLTFADDAGRTAIGMTAVPLDATAEECHTFAAALGGMAQGWTGTLDKLDAFLATEEVV